LTFRDNRGLDRCGPGLRAALGYLPEVDPALRGRFDHVLGTLVQARRRSLIYRRDWCDRATLAT
jgi:hypothetical protein